MVKKRFVVFSSIKEAMSVTTTCLLKMNCFNIKNTSGFIKLCYLYVREKE